MNRSKLAGIAYTLILVLSLLASTATVTRVAHATITGRPTLYYVDENGDTHPANDPLSVPAVFTDPDQRLAISLKEMDIGGAQIWIWFSKTGGAVIEPEDAVFLGPIYLGDIIGSTSKNVSVKVYYPFSEYVSDDNPATPEVEINVEIGNNWVNITQLPGIFEAGVNYWIKITDVDPRLKYSIPSSDVSVSTNRINFTATFYAYSKIGGDLEAVPDELISVGGYAVSPGGKYNITLYYLAKTEVVYANVTAETQTEPAGDINPEWTWTGFVKEFHAPDLELRYPPPDETESMTFTVKVINATEATDVKASFTFDQPPRKVYFPSDGAETLIEHGDQTAAIELETGKEYNITLANFPSNGYVEIKFNGTWAVEPSRIDLNATGGVYNATITILYNVPETGVYNFTIKDNHGVIYWFLVKVVISPGISIEPSKGHVGDVAVVTGIMFNDYVGKRINIWFQVNDTHYRLVANWTLHAPSWSISIVIPHATKGNKSVVVTEDLGGNKVYEQKEAVTPAIAETVFEVIPKLVVEPSEFPADYGEIVYVAGTGFDPAESYKLAVDNQFLQEGLKANGTGDLYVTLVGAGFAPGLHVVALYENITEPAFYALFTVTPPEGAATLDDVMSELEDIKTGVSDLKEMLTQLGDQLILKLEEVHDDLVSVIVEKGDEVVLEITARLDELEPVITDVAGDVAYVRTVVGEMVLDVDELVDGQAEIKSLITTAKGDVVASISTAKGDILAELSTIEELISSGVKADTAKILSEISALKTAIKDSEILSKLEELAATLEDVSSKVAGIDDIKSTVVDVKSAVSDLAGMEEDIKSYIDDAAKDVKDSVSGTVSAYGIAGIVLAIIVLALVALSIFRKRE